MIHVEERALRSFEQHGLAALQGLPDRAPGVHRQRQQPGCQPLEQLHVLSGVCPFGGAEQAEDLVGRLDASAHELLGPAQVPQVAHADAAASVLVLVRRPDAPPRRADLLSRLTCPIEQFVEREGEVGTVGHIELVLRADSAFGQRIELGEQGFGIEHDAVPDHADGALDDPRGNLVQHELSGARVHRVPRVRPALVAHDQVGALGEHIDDLALAFVAPLSAHDDDAVSFRSEHGSPAKTPRKRGVGVSSEGS